LWSYIQNLSNIKFCGLVTNPRGIEVRELIGTNIWINDNKVLMKCPGIRDVTNPETKEGQYLRAEFVWYMSGSLKTDFISMFGKMWSRLGNKFSEQNIYNEKINSNYGYHVFYKPAAENLTLLEEFDLDMENVKIPQFYWAKNELEKDRNSRKAILQYTWPLIYLPGVNDFTCTQTQHFMIRETYDGLEELYNLVNIRSSDAIKGLTFDLPWWSFVGQYMAKLFGIENTPMKVSINSSHYYSTDEALVDQLIQLNKSNSFRMTSLILREFSDMTLRIRSAVRFVKSYFNDKDLYGIFDKVKLLSESDPISAVMLLCNTIVNEERFKRVSRDVICEINNQIFDSVFKY